jgi:hypothetical protein
MDELESYNETEANRKFTDKEIKKAKFRLLKSLNKIHNIVIHIRNSDSRADYFRKLIKKMIPIDNRTK